MTELAFKVVDLTCGTIEDTLVRFCGVGVISESKFGDSLVIGYNDEGHIITDEGEIITFTSYVTYVEQDNKYKVVIKSLEITYKE